MLSDRGSTYPVHKRDLDKLVKAGLVRQENSRYRAK